jgi:hypothetical protein
MRKIVKDNKIYNIDCEDNKCRNCEYQPFSTGVKCKLFDSLLDHILDLFNNQRKH